MAVPTLPHPRKSLIPVNTTWRDLSEFCRALFQACILADQVLSGDSSYQDFKERLAEALDTSVGRVTKLLTLGRELGVLETRPRLKLPGQPFVVVNEIGQDLATGTPTQKKTLLCLLLLHYQREVGAGCGTPVRPGVALVNLAAAVQRASGGEVRLSADSLALYGADPSSEQPSELTVRRIIACERELAGLRPRARRVAVRRMATCAFPELDEWLEAVKDALMQPLSNGDLEAALDLLGEALDGSRSRATEVRDTARALFEDGEYDQVLEVLARQWFLAMRWQSHRDFCKTALKYLRDAGGLGRTGVSYGPTPEGLRLMDLVTQHSATTSESTYRQRLASSVEVDAQTDPLWQRLRQQLLEDRRDRPAMPRAQDASVEVYEFAALRNVAAALDAHLDVELLQQGMRTPLDDALVPTTHAPGEGADSWLSTDRGIVAVEVTKLTREGDLLNKEVEPVVRHRIELEQSTGAQVTGVFVAPEYCQGHALMLAFLTTGRHRLAYRQVHLTEDELTAISSGEGELEELIALLEPVWEQLTGPRDYTAVLAEAREVTEQWIAGLRVQRRPQGIAA